MSRNSRKAPPPKIWSKPDKGKELFYTCCGFSCFNGEKKSDSYHPGIERYQIDAGVPLQMQIDKDTELV